MSTVSILMITLDRFEVTKPTWETNIKRSTVSHAPIQRELLVCDNDSSDPRIIEYMDRQPLKYFRKNKINEGVGRAFNQLYLRSSGKYVAILGNDIVMPEGWLNTAIAFLNKIPRPGLIGFDWRRGHELPPITEKFGVNAHWLTPKLNRVFGAWVFRRELVEDLGLFYEGYGPYGIEDSDMNERVNRSGYNSCYIPNMPSEHLVNDVGHNSEYRKMKDESLAKNATIFNERVAGFDRGETLKCELPPMIVPLGQEPIEVPPPIF